MDMPSIDLSPLQKAADALSDALACWQEQRDLRNRTSHSYDEQQAQAIAEEAALFLTDAQQLLKALQASLRHA